VISVVLLIGIVVILGAVVATYALGMTDNLSEAGPQTAIEVSDASDDFGNASDNAGNDQQAWEGIVDIVHEGGDPLPANEIEISIRDASSNTLIARWNGELWVSGPNHNDAAFKSARTGNTNWDPTQKFDSNPLSSGDRIIPVITEPVDNEDGEYTIQINHKPTDTLVTKQTVYVS
jgi:FlaG/FlaF family flagellin (archaellin)